MLKDLPDLSTPKATSMSLHHGADDKFVRFALGGQAFAEAFAASGLVKRGHCGHGQGLAEEGMADLG